MSDDCWKVKVVEGLLTTRGGWGMGVGGDGKQGDTDPLLKDFISRQKAAVMCALWL